MRHVALDQMAGGKSTAETQFAREHASRNDASESTCIVAWRRRVRATDAEHVQCCSLRFKDSTAANGTHLDRWHGNVNLEIPMEPVEQQRQPKQMSWK